MRKSIAVASGAVALAAMASVASAGTYYWTSAVDGNWSVAGGWTLTEGAGTRPLAATNVTDIATIDATGANYTVTKGSYNASGASLFSFLLNSANATLYLNDSHIRGLELSNGGVAELRSGTLRIGKGTSNANGAFFINDQLGPGTYSASLIIGANATVDLASNYNTGPSSLTYVPSNGGRVFITEQKGKIDIGITAPGVGINHVPQHLFISDGFTNEGVIRLSNTRTASTTPGSGLGALGSNSSLSVGTGTLLNKGTIEVLKGASDGTDSVIINETSGPVTYQANERDLVLTLDNDTTGLLSVSNDGAKAARLGRATAAAHTNGGNIAIVAGATLALTADNTLANEDGGVIRGSGTLDVSSSGSGLSNAGILAAGGSGATGQLTINGGFTSSDTASLAIELGSDVSYDVLDVINGTAGLDGDLDVTLLSGFTPDQSDVFTILTGLNSGGFDNVIGGVLDLGDGFGFDVDYNNDGVVLSNYSPIAVPEPSVLGVLSIGALAVLQRRRRA